MGLELKLNQGVHLPYMWWERAGRGLNVSVPCVECLLETVPVHAGNARQVGDPTPPVDNKMG